MADLNKVTDIRVNGSVTEAQPLEININQDGNDYEDEKGFYIVNDSDADGKLWVIPVGQDNKIFKKFSSAGDGYNLLPIKKIIGSTDNAILYTDILISR